MILLNKALCFLLLGFLAGEIIPQEQFYISTNGDINNSHRKRSIYNLSTITPLKNENSSKSLDSLICNFSNGSRIRIKYAYNDDLSLNHYTFSNWFNGQWIISDKRTNTYNSYGKLKSVLWEWFNASLQVWLNDAKDEYNYDSIGNMNLHLHLDFNGQEFENDFKNEFYYVNENNLVSSVSFDWDDSIWVNRSKSFYTYTTGNLNDTTFFQIWVNNQWINYQMNVFEYNEKLNVITNLVKRWVDNNWLNFGKGSFEYDANNNCVQEIWVIANNNSWENWFRIFYEYDENNNLIHLFGEEWLNGQWVPEDEPLRVINPDGILIGFLAKEIFLYYSLPTSIGNEKNIVTGSKLFQNYPNPFNPLTTISYQIKEQGFVQLKVYNLLGQEIVTLVNEEMPSGIYETLLDASNLPSGVYIYSLRVNDFVQNNKMTLLK
ncbi:MAG: T9SS type A sorting domain-containing protein [Ignavibacteriaceae bacterium]|nr:T9SS type A sorting domain-containing protein [Ignavibacteriaceae bacterium]